MQENCRVDSTPVNRLAEVRHVREYVLIRTQNRRETFNASRECLARVRRPVSLVNVRVDEIWLRCKRNEERVDLFHIPLAESLFYFCPDANA